jgi:L-threonylcarbamoyladenylate synthase
MPLIAMISDINEINDLALDISPDALKLTDAFWPGALTVVVPKKSSTPAWGTANLPTIAIRMPSNDASRLLVEHSKTAIYAPSANLSGKPSPTSADHVLQDLDGKIEAVLDGGQCVYGLESTVLDISEDIPRILRPGFITAEMIFVQTGILPKRGNISEAQPKSPGVKYKHYAPNAELTVVNGSPSSVATYINKQASSAKKRIGVLATDQTFDMYDLNKYSVLNVGDRSKPELIGAGLYAALRKFDELCVDIIFAEGIAGTGIGEAVMNRMAKAAGGRVVNL